MKLIMHFRQMLSTLYLTKLVGTHLKHIVKLYILQEFINEHLILDNALLIPCSDCQIQWLFCQLMHAGLIQRA